MEFTSEPSRSHQRSARIAVVDDDAVSSAIHAHLVCLLGHRALIETAPALAIERALDGQFDLILLDFHMPASDGFETLRRLREKETSQKRPPVPVIAVTGYVSEQDRLRCLMGGFADQVSKPLQVEAFRAALHRVLGWHGEPASAGFDGHHSDADRLRATIRRMADVPPKERGFGPTVMESFALRSQQLIDAIRVALDERSEHDVARNARAMRSFADFLGATRLSAMCVHVEQSMLDLQWALAEQTLEDIEHENQAILAVLFESAR